MESFEETPSNLKPFDPKALLMEEVQNLSRRVDALIKWTEEFEEGIIFFGKLEPKEGKSKDSSEEQKNKDGMQSPWGGESPEEFNSGEEVALEATEVDIFGASPTFADWTPMEDEAKKPEATPISLLQWD